MLTVQEPKTDEEKAYCLLFEEFKPVFRWTASEPRDPKGSFDLSQLSTPAKYERLTGNFFQGLCDYSVMKPEKEAELGRFIDDAVPKERRLYADEEWSPSIMATTRSLFLYPEDGYIQAVTRYSWPALRILIFHNSDNSTHPKAFTRFLEEHPNVHIWLVNNLIQHPRVRTLPLFFENRMWLILRTIEREDRICLEGGRDIRFLLPGFTVRGKVRERWMKEKEELRDFRDLWVAPFMGYDDALDMLATAEAVVCPPGNGADTHRHWEALLSGCSLILDDNDHTRNLIEEYPSLPITAIKSLQDLRGLPPFTRPTPRFHPILLKSFWKILFDSHIYEQPHPV